MKLRVEKTATLKFFSAGGEFQIEVQKSTFPRTDEPFRVSFFNNPKVEGFCLTSISLNKIQCIKLVRGLSGSSLMEAKDAVDQL